MKKSKIQNFLLNHIPFSFLKEEEAKILFQNALLKRFKKGETVFHAGETTKWFYILYEGLILLTRNSHVLDYVRVGEALNVIPAVSGKPVNMDAMVEEDSTCILVPCEDLRRVFNLNKDFSSYHVNLSEKKFTSLYRVYGGKPVKVLEEDLAVCRVEDTPLKSVVSCFLDTEIRDAVRLMQEKNVGSIVVVDGEKKPVGIVTCRDLRGAMVGEVKPTEPVSKIMKTPAVTINGKNSVYDAYLLLTSKAISHLVVVDDGFCVKGVVTPKDLMFSMEPAFTLTTISKRVFKAENVEELRWMYRYTVKAVISLFNRGLNFQKMSLLFTRVNDMFTRKILEFAEKKLGEEGFGKPIHYAWMDMGSSGREEQVFCIDQDNLLIYSEKDGKEVFEKLALTANNMLEKAGIPKCRDGYMASNPRWGGRIKDWKECFSFWVNQPEGENLLSLSLLLDSRFIYGDKSLAEELKNHIIENSSFEVAKALAQTITKTVTPVAFLGRIKYGRRGFDVKTQGLLPIVNGVKALAFESKIYATNTLKRIDLLIERGILPQKAGGELKETYQFLSSLKLKHQLNQYLAGENPDSFIKPEELTELEEKILKECFKVIMDYGRFLSRKYSLTYYP